VLIMDDKEIDEIVTPAIGEYKEWKFVDISTVEAPAVEDKEEKNSKKSWETPSKRSE